MCVEYVAHILVYQSHAYIFSAEFVVDVRVDPVFSAMMITQKHLLHPLWAVHRTLIRRAPY